MRRRPRKPHHAPPFSPAYAVADTGAKTLLVPGYRQARNYSCGFATALMVVRYFRPHAPARELFDALGTTRDGTRQNAMVRAIRACGLGANVRYDVDFARLQQEIDRNKHVVGYLHDSDHWVVVYGYGCDPQRVYIADPEPGEPCVHSWQRYREKLAGFGIVCSCARMSRRRAPPAVPHRLALPPAPAVTADEAPAALS